MSVRTQNLHNRCTTIYVYYLKKRKGMDKKFGEKIKARNKRKSGSGLKDNLEFYHFKA